MTSIRTFASGSSGNAALLSCGEIHLLIDMGISCRRICQSLTALGLTPGDLAGVLITHEHGDHIGGLATYIKKYPTPIHCTPAVSRQLAYRLAGVEPLLRPMELGETAVFGPVEAEILPTSHDCRESAAWRFTTPEGRVGYLTDTGYIVEETGRRLLGADILVLESNHDVEMLRAGPYPYPLKRRILGEQGHLSNDAAAAYAVETVRAGTGTILLAHLSDENNTPRQALETVGGALAEAGLAAFLTAAPRDVMSEAFCLEGVRCSG
ncbi:MAG: MBL fold metallo-hydrolase [Oscillospiraceae bacterium]|nr:MBL fold metallo-hydrolase [Oscillospiraceae bacterium]